MSSKTRATTENGVLLALALNARCPALDRRTARSPRTATDREALRGALDIERKQSSISSRPHPGEREADAVLA